MKKLILLCICFGALAISLPGQTPTTPPGASPSAAAATATATATTTTTTATPAPITSASPSDLADRIHRKLEKKFRGHHGIIIDGSDHEGADHEKSKDEIPAMVIPLVGIVFLTIFGAPVAIVIAVGLFVLIGSRMLQGTIRMTR